MRDLQAIYDICVQECKDAEIPIRNIEKIKITTKSKKNISGYGYYLIDEGKDEYIIWINPTLLKEDCPLVELKDTIIHELIHTCDRCWTHSKTWMKYARIMNDKYGYELTTIKDDDAIFHKDKPILHHFVCPKCGSIYNLREEIVIGPNTYCVCGFCGTDATMIY